MAGRLSGRAWLQLDHGKFTELTSDLAVRGLSWAARPGPALRGEYAQFRVQGLPGDFIQTDSLALARSPGAPNASLKGRAERFQFTLPDVFEQPTVKVGELDVDAQVKARMRATGSSTSPSCGSATRTWTRACKANGAPRARPPPAAPTCAA